MNYRTIALICNIIVIILVNTGNVTSIVCPKLKGEKAGAKELLTCGNQATAMMKYICKKKPEDRFPSKLLRGVVINVGLRALKCLDETLEFFLVDEAINCCATDSEKGINVLADWHAMCDPKKKAKLMACAMDAISMHKEDLVKLKPYIPHLASLALKVVKAIHAECMKMWPDFPKTL